MPSAEPGSKRNLDHNIMGSSTIEMPESDYEKRRLDARSLSHPAYYLADPVQKRLQRKRGGRHMLTRHIQAPMAMGGFATTLLTVSLAMMEFRGVHVQTVFVGNLCFVAGIGLLISAQWEVGNGQGQHLLLYGPPVFWYQVADSKIQERLWLMCYKSLFYGGYGAIMIPVLGIADAYGGDDTPEYYNAIGFFVLSKSQSHAKVVARPDFTNNTDSLGRPERLLSDRFHAIVSFRPDRTPVQRNTANWSTTSNIVYILIFTTVELCFALDASSYFARADGKIATSDALMKSAGVFGFISGLLGYYTTLHYLCSHALPFRVPMGDTSKYFARMKHGRL